MRVQTDSRQAGNEAQRQTAYDQDYRLGDAKLLGKQGQHRHRHQQAKNEVNRVNHRPQKYPMSLL